MVENLNVKQSTKCVFYDRVYCKQKLSCLQKHISIDCDNYCNDKTTCPNQHRVLCKTIVYVYNQNVMNFFTLKSQATRLAKPKIRMSAVITKKSLNKLNVLKPSKSPWKNSNRKQKTKQQFLKEKWKRLKY